jgi:hypothetical protein
MFMSRSRSTNQEKSMNGWAQRMLADLTAKREELHRQLVAVDSAIDHLETGFDMEPMELPEVFTRKGDEK